MKFYQEIHEIYDQLFPSNLKKLKFLQATAPGPRILDIAGGVGDDALYLKNQGFQVEMNDGEEKMVEEALKKGVDAKHYSMLDIPEDQTYDFVYCVGNSLVHLASLEEIQSFLSKTYRLLEPQGRLVLQIINFHPFLKNKGDFLGKLPLIENENYRFERSYYRREKKILFHTLIEGKGDQQGINYENEVLLYPLLKEDLVASLEEVGFQNIEVFSSWEQGAYDPEKTPLIVRCSK